MIYPATGTLRNLYGIEEEERWTELEKELVNYRESLISPGGIVGDDLGAELKAYHHHLFQDCYTWAGSFRDVDMSKENFLTGTQSLFASWETIESRLNELDPYLYALEDTDFARKMEIFGYLHSELNEIHPFREGNGRTIRAFMTHLAGRYDIVVDWANAKDAQMIAAAGSMLGDELDSTPWKNLYLRISSIADWTDEEESLGIYDLLNEEEGDLTFGKSLIDTIGLPDLDLSLEETSSLDRTGEPSNDTYSSGATIKRNSELEL